MKNVARLLSAVFLISTVSPLAAAAEPWVNPIVKRGYLNNPTCEVSPFVLNRRLYRLESWQKYWEIPGLPPVWTRANEDSLRIWDVETGKLVSEPLTNHGFATVIVWEGRVYVFTGAWDLPNRKAGTIDMISSDDCVNWTKPVTVWRAEKGETLYNVAVCRDADRFVMLYETDDPKYPPFTFKYCMSADLKTWTRLPDALYGTNKYVGGPALYWFDGTYYTLYLEDLGGRWETRITRSTDLIKWEDAPKGRPFVTFDSTRTGMPLRPAGTKEINASDAELCEWPKGKTFIYFTGSDQQYAGDVQWATYDGTPKALLEHFFKQ